MSHTGPALPTQYHSHSPDSSPTPCGAQPCTSWSPDTSQRPTWSSAPAPPWCGEAGLYPGVVTLCCRPDHPLPTLTTPPCCHSLRFLHHLTSCSLVCLQSSTAQFTLCEHTRLKVNKSKSSAPAPPSYISSTQWPQSWMAERTPPRSKLYSTGCLGEPHRGRCLPAQFDANPWNAGYGLAPDIPAECTKGLVTAQQPFVSTFCQPVRHSPQGLTASGAGPRPFPTGPSPPNPPLTPPCLSYSDHRRMGSFVPYFLYSTC